MNIFSFVAAASGSGKTTLIEKIVRILKTRGLEIAVVKHASKGFDMDRPGKDSWRFREAGAASVMLVSPDQMALIRSIKDMPSMEEIERFVGDADIIIYEGFKKNAPNKIEVFRAGPSGDRPLCLADPTFIALASDTAFDVQIPRFDINDADAIASFILSRIK